MSLSVRCPNAACGKTAQVPESYRQRWLRCRSCRHKFRVADALITACDAPAAPTAGETNSAFVTAGAAPAPAFTAPAHIGRFELRQRLGAGAFGVVHRAFDPHLRREVALKLPQAGALGRPDLLDRFLREARAAAGLRHPHIVPVFDAGQVDGQHYIASAFIRGRTLSAVIAGMPLEARRAARLARDLAAALAYAHGQGIIHRDVKSANVLIDGRDQAHLLDFGLAWRAEASAQLTRAGAIVGTPAYMAPEAAAGRQGAPQPAEDQYSLGVVLYEMLTGRTPFQGPPQIVLFNVLNQDPPAPRALNPAVPRDLETVCLKALAREPGRRYAGCGELADDLRRWLDGEVVRARRQGLAERVVRWARREPRLVGLVGLTVACLLVVAVLAVWTMTGLERSRDEAMRQTEAATKEEESATELAEVSRQLEQSAREKEEQTRKARQEAAASAGEAKAAQEKAETEAQAARTAREKAVAAEQEGQQGLYAAHMTLARQALRRKELPRAKELLARYLPQAGGNDLRDDTWRELDGVAHYLENPKGNGAVLQERGPFKGHAGPVNLVCLSRDGKLLASTGQDLTIRLWDMQTGAERAILEGPRQPVHCLCFSPDGKILAAAWDDRTIRIWETETGKERATLEGHAKLVNSLCFSPDGKTLVSGSDDGTIRIWTEEKANPFGPAVKEYKDVILRGHAGAVHAVCFSPDGKTLASAGGDRMIKLWEPAQTSAERATLKGSTGAVHSVCFTPDSQTLVSASDDKMIRLWDMRNYAVSGTFRTRGNRGSPVAIWLSPDGNILATASESRTIRLWDIATKQERAKFSWGPVDQPGAMGPATVLPSACFSTDNRTLVAAGGDETIRFWDTLTGRLEPPFIKGHASTVHSICFSPDGRTLASVSSDATIKFWDTQTGQEGKTLTGPTGGVHAVCFSPDGKWLASGGNDRTIKIWDVLKGQLWTTLTGHTGAVRSICFSPDGKALASTGDDRTIRIWDVPSFTPRASHQTDAVQCVCEFSPDGKTLASAGWDRTIALWDAQTGARRGTRQGHTGAVLSICFSPDGRTLASASQDRTIKLWDARTGQPFASLAGNDSRMSEVCFSPDGKWLAWAGGNTLKVWDVWTGQALLTIDAPASCVRFSPDGKWLAAGAGQAVRWWKVRRESSAPAPPERATP
jgi:WD40 repeat protein